MLTKTLDNQATGEGLYGERGWTTKRAIANLLAPYQSNSLGRSHTPQSETKELPSFSTFSGLGAVAAEQLRHNLTAANLKDRQNLGPRCDELLDIAVDNPNEIRLHGYAVGPARYDERVTIEGLWVAGFSEYEIDLAHGEECDCEDLWDTISEYYGIVTALAPPDEIWPMSGPFEPWQSGWWLWWD